MANVNELNFEQASTLLNDVKKMVTGQESIAPINSGEFVSVAFETLNFGLDPVMNAITQVLGRTIVSERPYTRKFKGLQVDSMRYGAIARKLSIVDLPMEDSKQFDLDDDTSVDMYTIRKQKVLQTNLFGANQYSYHRTITKDQLFSAFRNETEFSDFMSGLATNFMNTIEQNRESQSRIVLANLIAGRVDGANNGIAEESVVHLLTEYNAETGLSLDAQSVKAPENYPAFIKWVYARVEQLCDLMTERSQMFQTDVEGKEINRHTPRADQRIYMMNQDLAAITNRVLADTYHENFLNMSLTEGVNYWQSIETVNEVQAVPSYMAKDGSIITASGTVTVSPIFAIIMDRDSAGLTLVNEETTNTPYNSAGKYWNIWHTGTWKWWTDFSEKSIVLLLD